MSTILIVDDDADMRSFMRTLLESAGHTIDEAASGQEALDKTDRYDLVILDHYMPGMSGVEVADMLSMNNQAFIFVSTASEFESEGKSIIDQAINFGSLGFVKKPFSRTQLLASIDSALKHAKTIRRLTRSLTSNLAAGIIMAQERIPEDEAKNYLRSLAKSRSQRTEELAEKIISLVGELNELRL